MNFFCRTAVFSLIALLPVTTALAADTPRFDVTRYQVEGNSILPQPEIDRILARFTGNASDFGTLQQAVEALEQGYRLRGYHAVKVFLPEQELKGGVVRLNVVEVRVGSVSIEGNKYFDNENIRRSIPELEEGKVPNLDKISMNIRVANENPAKKVQMMLQGGDNKDVTTAQIKVVDEKPWKFGVSMDDTGNDLTGKYRLGFNFQHSNLFNSDNLLTLQYTTSPDHLDKVSIYNAGYRIPIYGWGDSIDLYGGYSDVYSGTVQAGLLAMNVSGKGAFGGIRYNQNLTRVGTYEHRLLYGFDYRRFENNIDYAGVPFGDITEVMPVSLGYAGAKSFSSGSEISGWGSVTQNVPSAANGKTADFSKARKDAKADFTLFRAGSTMVYVSPADVQARFTVTGQYTWLRLIPGEQFGMGGQGTLRGFGERDLADDSGVVGSVELYTPNILKGFKKSNSHLKLLAFYDVGHLERNKPEPGEEKLRNAASAGVGMRLAIDRYLSASTDYAFVVEPQGKYTNGSSRLHFKINLMF